MKAKKVLKTIGIVSILFTVPIWFSRITFASSDSLRDQQIRMFGPRWLINSTANDNARDMAMDNVSGYNDLEKYNLDWDVNPDDERDIDVKGPKDVQGAKTTKIVSERTVVIPGEIPLVGVDGVIDMDDYEMIINIFMGSEEDLPISVSAMIDYIFYELFYPEFLSAEGSSKWYVVSPELGDDLTAAGLTFLYGVRYGGNLDTFGDFMGRIYEFVGSTSDSDDYRACFDIAGDPIIPEKTISVISEYNHNIYYSLFLYEMTNFIDAGLSDRSNAHLSGSDNDLSQLVSFDSANDTGLDTAAYLITDGFRDIPAFDEDDAHEDVSTDEKKGMNFLDVSEIKEQSLETMVSNLKAKANRTEMEERALIVAEAVMRAARYIDEDTRGEFESVMRYIAMAELLDDMLGDADLAGLNGALDQLMEKQKTAYDRYLSKTEKIYDNIALLLNVDTGKLILPDVYLDMPGLPEREKKKIHVDIAVREVMIKDRQKLKKNDMEAVKIYKDRIMPLQDTYRGSLKEAIEKFIFVVRKTVIDKTPVTVSKDETQFKGLVIIDREKPFSPDQAFSKIK